MVGLPFYFDQRSPYVDPRDGSRHLGDHLLRCMAGEEMNAARVAAEARVRDTRGVPPKRRSNATDFRPLSPGPKARHTYARPAKEQDSMQEGPISFVPGSRGRHLDKFKRKGA